MTSNEVINFLRELKKDYFLKGDIDKTEKVKAAIDHIYVLKSMIKDKPK